MTIFRIFFVSISLLLLNACDSDDEAPNPCDAPDSALNINCPDYDPCLTVDPATSDFLIRAKANFGSPVFDSLLSLSFDNTDTLSPGGLNFYATTEAETYEWSVSGSNQIWTGREVDIYFQAFVAGSTLEVTLTTTVSNQSDCLAASELTSSSSRNINFKASEFDSPYRGSYLGKHCDSDEAERVIEIVEGFVIVDNYFVNFPYECFHDNTEPRKVQVGFYGRQFMLVSDDPASSNFCGQPIGTGEFSNNDQQIDFTYRHTNQDGTYEYRCWSGVRIN